MIGDQDCISAGRGHDIRKTSCHLVMPGQNSRAPPSGIKGACPVRGAEDPGHAEGIARRKRTAVNLRLDSNTRWGITAPNFHMRMNRQRHGAGLNRRGKQGACRACFVDETEGAGWASRLQGTGRNSEVSPIQETPRICPRNSMPRAAAFRVRRRPERPADHDSELHPEVAPTFLRMQSPSTRRRRARWAVDALKKRRRPQIERPQGIRQEAERFHMGLMDAGP